MKTGVFKSMGLFPLLMLLFMSGCQSKTVEAPNLTAPSSFDTEQILVHGLGEKDFTITLGDLKKLAVVTQHAEATRSNGEKISVDATGPLLDTFLQKYGKSQRDFQRIRFSAKDKYSIAVPADILNNRPIILSYVNDGKPLQDDWQPVRVVIPGERAMYWVKDMIRMDFETGNDQTTVNKLVFLETAAQHLSQQDYQYYGSNDKAVKNRDLISKYADIDDEGVADVYIKAGDGLQKNETKTNFLEAYIKMTGQDAPLFTAPQFPQGMSIHGLLYITYGQTAIFDFTTGLTCLPQQNSEGKEGIAFSQIIKQTNLAGGNKYSFTTGDGNSVEIATIDLGNGLIYKNEQGDLSFTAQGTSGNRTIDKLLSIQAIP